MIFIDSNVLMYAVGRTHPLRAEAQTFFALALAEERALCTSAEVLQELLHAYLPVRRLATLDAALTLAKRSLDIVWPVEEDDVRLARLLSGNHPQLSARDLLHLASCRRRGVTELKTFDRNLQASFVR